VAWESACEADLSLYGGQPLTCAVTHARLGKEVRLVYTPDSRVSGDLVIPQGPPHSDTADLAEEKKKKKEGFEA